jgi:hypothetical protein
METVTQDSVKESSRCPEVSVKVPASSEGVAYRFASVFAAAQQCQNLAAPAGNMRNRMSQVMYHKQIGEAVVQGRKDCIHCVQGKLKKVSAGNVRLCKIFNPGRVNEGGCFVAGQDGKPTQTQVEDSCCDKK